MPTVVSQAGPTPDHVQLALWLGWTFAEVNGHLKLAQSWGENKSPSRRLFLSHPSPNYGETLWLLLQHLVVLVEQLFPTIEKMPPVCPIPQTLQDFFDEITQKLSPDGDKSPLSNERITEIYTALDVWSRECWVRLGSISPVMTEAATFGGSLADTYWAWVSPPDVGCDDIRVKA